MTVRATKPKINVRESLTSGENINSIITKIGEYDGSLNVGTTTDANRGSKIHVQEQTRERDWTGRVVSTTDKTGIFLGTYTADEHNSSGVMSHSPNLDAWDHLYLNAHTVADVDNPNKHILSGGGAAGKYILASGNVGINTPYPDAALDVQSTGAVSNRFYTSNDQFTAHPHNGTLLMAFRIPNTSKWDEHNSPVHASCDITLRVMTVQSVNHTSTGVKSYHMMLMRPHNNSGTAATSTVVDLRVKDGSTGDQGLYQEVGSAATCNSFDLVADVSGTTTETQYVRLKLNSIGDTGTAVFAQMSVNYTGSAEINRSS
jgi:hypothetical protein